MEKNELLQLCDDTQPTKKSLIEEVVRYKRMYDLCMQNIDILLQKEWSKLNEFLDDYSIFLHPDGRIFKNGKEITRDEFEKIKKDEHTK